MSDEKIQNLDVLHWPVEASPLAQKCAEGNFGAIIQNSTLLLHLDTIDALRKAKMRITYLVDFISYAQFTATIASALNMTNQGAVQAYDLLKEQLKPHIPNHILNYEPPKKGFGALMPEDIK